MGKAEIKQRATFFHQIGVGFAFVALILLRLAENAEQDTRGFILLIALCAFIFGSYCFHRHAEKMLSEVDD